MAPSPKKIKKITIDAVSIVKPLTYALENISIEDVFLNKRCTDFQAEADRERLQTGGLDRAAFLDKVFSRLDPLMFPVGHLMDHRVRMPLATAEAALRAGEVDVKRLLRRMLSMSANPKASSFVANSLGRRPQADAKLLCEWHESHPQFAALCLSGRFGDFSKDVPVPEGSAFTAPVAMMALYYGALELQLIALRQWAIEQFRIGVDAESETSTMGQVAKDILSLFNGLEFIAKSVRAGRTVSGRRPNVVQSLKSKAEQELAAIKSAHPDLSDDDILKITDKLFVQSRDSHETEHEKFKAMRKALAEVKKGQGQALRKLSSTVIANAESGEQVAFAAIRLLALDKGLHGAIQHPKTVHRTDGLSCFGQLPVWNDRRLGTLYLVSMRLLRQDQLYGPLVDRNGVHADLKAQIKISADEGTTIGQETFKTVRETQQAWFGRTTAARGTPLTGSSKWDILPCYRFAASSRDDEWKFHPVPTPKSLLEMLQRT